MGPRVLFARLAWRFGGRFPNGFTNRTIRRGQVVIKRFRGRGASRRFRCEAEALTRLAGRFPVPELRAVDEGRLTLRMAYVAGHDGGSGEASARPASFLSLAGEVLRRLHSLGRSTFEGACFRAAGETPLNGDFNPYNLVFDPAADRVAAVLDWEQAQLGDPITDLAWFEWVVRVSLPALTPGLPAFYSGYGHRPGWTERKAEMLRRCAEIVAVSRAAGEASGVTYWSRRLAQTQGWDEVIPPGQ